MSTSAPTSTSAALRARLGSRLLATGAHRASPHTLAVRVADLVAEECPLLAAGERARVVSEVMADLRGLGPLEALMHDPEVTEIMLNGPGSVWVERRGALERVAMALDAAAIEHLIEKVVSPLGLRVDRSAPIVDARLSDGSRVNAVVAPLAVDGPYLTVRRFGARVIALAEFAPPAVEALLEWAVTARRNIMVCGGTGSGKTTLLNALAAHIPDGERVVTVEDTAELRLPGSHVVRLEARPANSEGTGAVRIRDLVRNALRMRPDRIVVGEVRGPEALDMLQAMNTGHEGSLSTCHANGADDALRRIETMVLMDEVHLPLHAVRAQLEASLDLVVQVARRPDGRRRVVAVAEVCPPAATAGVVGEGEGVAAAAGAGGRTVVLADEHGVRALPAKAPRVAGPGPDPEWLRL